MMLSDFPKKRKKLTCGVKKDFRFQPNMTCHRCEENTHTKMHTHTHTHENRETSRAGLFGRRLKRYPGPPPEWVNLYGAPAGKSKGRETEIMNRYPSRGSAYRGR